MILFFALCLAHAEPLHPAEAFEAWTGAQLAFEAEDLPEEMGYELFLELTPDQQTRAAEIALEQARHFPRGSLAEAGLTAVGIFAALGSPDNDGYHQWDEDLGGYAYFGMYNGKGMVVAAHYTDTQLPLTLHHEWFHLLDTEVADPAAPDLTPADRRALEKIRVHKGPVLRDAVSAYASKNPGEDRAETARHLHANLPDALLQIVEEPDLPGSQRFLHVLAVQEETTGAGFDWMVDVALDRTASQSHPRIRPDGQWAIHGYEDSDGVNWTLRGDLTALGAEATDLSSPREIVSHIALLAGYHAWIASIWEITDGTRVAFRGAVDDSIDALPSSHRVLARSLRGASLEELADHLDPDAVPTGPLTQTIVVDLAVDVDVNLYLSAVDETLNGKWRRAVRSVQPAMARVEVGHGTASGVNLSPEGLILTAAHVPERVGRTAKVRFPDGTALLATCIAVDSKLDLALLKIDVETDLPFASLAPLAPVVGDAVAIVGQPGSTTPGGAMTDYPPFDVSFGRIRELAADPLANQRRGGVGHDAWTYWGHSGSPLLDHRGRIVALHNSWNPENGMRHAVTWEALDAFVGKHR